MDIHPPEHPIRSLRDFVVQIFTVTCGIIIALGLEGVLTRHHERALATHARADFLAEIADNRAKVEAQLAQDPALEAWLGTLMAYGAAKLHHQSPKEPDAGQGRSFAFLPSSAWDTALATQAMSQLSFAEARMLSSVYNRQAALNNLAMTAREQWVRLAAWGDFADLTDADIRDALKELRISFAYAHSIAALQIQVRDKYQAAQEELAKH